jgi:hypothetical protein
MPRKQVRDTFIRSFLETYQATVTSLNMKHQEEMKYKNIREEELKNKVAADWFKPFDTTEILGNIDFTVFPKQDNLFGRTPILCAESKTGDFDIPTMFVQLILTIGKARTFNERMPPAFLGAFDFKKIAFLSYINIQDIFYLNDFNWNVAPSNHETKEFKIIKERIESTIKQKIYVFDYEKDKIQLLNFIKNNVSKSITKNKIKIDKNNFIPIYLRWLEFIKPIIYVNWEELKNSNILDSDFFIADLFVDDKGTENLDDDLTIKDGLFVVFKNQGYKIAKDDIHQLFDATITINNNETYEHFWKIYKRPPIKEYQDYIIKRRDLLVPQDIRERKGAFFTPQKWVELSQKYITKILGVNWQDEYYIWDCAAGTGNLLAGLTNKYNIYASTLDQADVNVMHDRIEQGANLLESHVFKFDFLNDDFSKLPTSLQDIIYDEKKRKKLIIYINPPYAEHGGNANGNTKTGVNLSKIHDKYHSQLSGANRELFSQFLIRIYVEIQGCKIGEFSKLKSLSGSHFKIFREHFKAKLEKMFIVPSYTFDNVKGKFPIGFKIWNTEIIESFTEISSDVFDENGDELEKKDFYSYEGLDYYSKWVNSIKVSSGLGIGWLQGVTRNDFQTQNGITIRNHKEQFKYPRGINIYDKNLIECCVCYAVRMCIAASWLNDRDQFLFPNDNWKADLEFQNDCLAYTLFKNDIRTNFGINHWIPFKETEVDSRERFESNFMTDYIKGKIQSSNSNEMSIFVEQSTNSNKPFEFSEEAISTFNSGRELWKYYHSKDNVNVNASLYEIREYFQGRNEKGKMNRLSDDKIYTELISVLRTKRKLLAKKIEPKIYEYRFLMK